MVRIKNEMVRYIRIVQKNRDLVKSSTYISSPVPKASVETVTTMYGRVVLPLNRYTSGG